MCKRNHEAYWFDDFSDMIEDYQIENPFLVSSTVQESDFEEVI